MGSFPNQLPSLHQEFGAIENSLTNCDRMSPKLNGYVAAPFSVFPSSPGGFAPVVYSYIVIVLPHCAFGILLVHLLSGPFCAVGFSESIRSHSTGAHTSCVHSVPPGVLSPGEISHHFSSLYSIADKVYHPLVIPQLSEHSSQKLGPRTPGISHSLPW
jgi:hypothetical protein